MLSKPSHAPFETQTLLVFLPSLVPLCSKIQTPMFFLCVDFC